ncbi:SMP-30/gluconolactonase/LRE family protein [Nisaea sp.]|uniref:SMP-30/gluconolactonase/LRE family protein n=1 Tax=Nisaea sp. TaxID=2024842 RepID=UPI003267AED6
MTITPAPMRKLKTECCELGEGPHYDARTDTAWWFDIVGKKLFEYCFSTAEEKAYALPRMASVIAEIDEQRQIIAMEDGLYIRAKSDGALTLLSSIEADNPSTRSNDGRVHPSGRLWIGTMGKNAEWQAGTIYCVDGLRVQILYRKITIPNSICFSPDGSIGYFADTAVNTVWRVRLDPASALPTHDPEPLLTGGDLPLGGHFDGSITDVDGNLWNAAWGGGSISGFTPDGTLITTIEIPAAQTSCAAFVGKDLDKLIVTSAWQGYDPAARASDLGAGFTYLIDGGFSGQLAPAFCL